MKIYRIKTSEMVVGIGLLLGKHEDLGKVLDITVAYNGISKGSRDSRHIVGLGLASQFISRLYTAIEQDIPSLSLVFVHTGHKSAHKVLLPLQMNSLI